MIDLTGVTSLSKTEAEARLAVAYPQLSAQDISDIMSPDLSNDDRAFIIKSYKDIGTAPTPSFWDDFVKIMGVVESVANLVIPITGAISGIYGVGTLGKA
jgi:hypothetical protein